MEKSLVYRWVVTLFVIFGVVAVVLSVVYLVSGNLAPDTHRRPGRTLPPPARTGPGFSTSTFILEMNNGRPIGDRVFIFRGRQGDQIRVDVIIPEIDSQYAYPFRFGIDDAKQGVEVAGLHLRLDAVRPTFVSFKTVP